MIKTMENTLGRETRGKKQINIEAESTWVEWVNRLARHARMSRPTVFDHALRKYAEEIGFEEPPPYR